jgi:hypothetical protein
MMHARIILPVAASTLILLSSAAHAQLFRAYLAADGNDANPCTLAQPCRLLPAALSAVASGGEIWMLDSANYNTGTVTIGKSVSIRAISGVVGSLVAVNNGPGVSITASALKVALRNVVIGPLAGATPGSSGIVMTGASQLEIEDCAISSLSSVGVYVSGTGMLKMSDCSIRNIGTFAVWIQNGARAVVASTRMYDNQGGVFVLTTQGSTLTEATVSGAVISGCDTGVYALANALSAISRVSVARTAIDNVGSGLRTETGTDGTAQIDFGGSVIVSGYYAWDQSGAGASILSLGDNQVSGNVAGAVGTALPLAPQ